MYVCMYVCMCVSRLCAVPSFPIFAQPRFAFYSLCDVTECDCVNVMILGLSVDTVQYVFSTICKMIC